MLSFSESIPEHPGGLGCCLDFGSHNQNWRIPWAAFSSGKETPAFSGYPHLRWLTYNLCLYTHYEILFMSIIGVMLPYIQFFMDINMLHIGFDRYCFFQANTDSDFRQPRRPITIRSRYSILREEQLPKMIDNGGAKASSTICLVYRISGKKTTQFQALLVCSARDPACHGYCCFLGGFILAAISVV